VQTGNININWLADNQGAIFTQSTKYHLDKGGGSLDKNSFTGIKFRRLAMDASQKAGLKYMPSTMIQII
jgi:hypothetical protein